MQKTPHKLCNCLIGVLLLFSAVIRFFLIAGVLSLGAVLLFNSSDSEDFTEETSSCRFALEKIDLADIKTYVTISQKEANGRNIKGFDISPYGDIIVTIGDKECNVYNSDLQFQYSIYIHTSGVAVGFWNGSEAAVYSVRGDIALGLDEKGTVVSAYHIEPDYESSLAYNELVSQRNYATAEYIYHFDKRSVLTRTDRNRNNEEIVYKNHHALQNGILCAVGILLFFALFISIIVMQLVLPWKRQKKQNEQMQLRQQEWQNGHTERIFSDWDEK